MAEIKNGSIVTVIAGTHKGKSGTVEDFNISKTGAATITIRQENGERFKTMFKSVTA